MKKIISIILSLVMILSFSLVINAESNKVEDKYIQLTKEDFEKMHTDERAQIEKELKSGKKLVKIEKRKIHFKKNEAGDLIPLTEEEYSSLSLTELADVTQDDLTLTLYILDNTREGSIYPVDYSFEGWFDWNALDNFPGPKDFAGIGWGNCNLASYYRSQTAWDRYGIQYSGTTNLGTADVVANSAYVAYYSNLRDGQTGAYLDHGWVFADVRQNTKYNLEQNVVFQYTHTSSGYTYTADIDSDGLSFSVLPITDTWDDFAVSNIWY